MRNFTAEQLIDAIREADDLSELKRMVGPSEDANSQSERRVNRIDAIGDKYGWDVNAMPWHIAEEYKRLNDEQGAFESEYC